MSYMFDNKDLFEGVTGVVEATRFEDLRLWQDVKKYRPEWTLDQSLSGPLVTVGHIGDRPICISVFVHTIGGERIAFVEATSQLVDWKMIEEWLMEHLPESALQQHNLKQGYHYLNKVDAGNFFNVFGNKAQ